MAPPIQINHAIPFYVDYFHAVSKTETKNIFKTNVGSVDITPGQRYDSYDIVDKVIRPLRESGILQLHGGDTLLVPLEGSLVMPDLMGTRFPLVMIGHGNHTGYFDVVHTKPKENPARNGSFTFTIRTAQKPSYTGYENFQTYLAQNGIASYSINLNIVNDLQNNGTTAFENMAIDFNQRVLLFFLHLKLLRIIAGEPITLPTADPHPIKFLTGTTLDNLTDALANPTIDPRLKRLTDVLPGRIDFTRLAFMGHSRGADAVSRIPAYFFNGAALPDPTFPFNAEVNTRIKGLSAQIGSPRQEVIKCILALEPVATLDLSTPPVSQHGYIINNNQTMYFVVVGTHDEDVSLDPVRIYEFPGCPKVMIAINGATHKRFNSVWGAPPITNPGDPPPVEPFDKLNVDALSLVQHAALLNVVGGSCLIGTLGGRSSNLLPFTKRTDFVIDLPGRIDFQSAWNFGFPLTNTPVNLDDKVTSTSQKNIKGQGYVFEQELKAFFVEKINEGTTTIRIPIDATVATLSNFNHFSFRFAKGFDVSDSSRVEEKNFTIQFFENDTPVGKPIAGPNINTLELKAFQAFDRRENNDQVIEYSILMQTAELTLAAHLTATELPRINRIDINVIPDITKSPPNSTAKVFFGTLGGALLGGLAGVGGGALWNRIFDPEEGKRNKILIGSGLVGTVALGGTALYILKADKHAFVFIDFLLTNRQIPAVATP